MNPSLTRRDFLKLFVPAWCTKQNLKIASIVTAVIGLLSLTVSLFRELGLSGTFKLFALALGAAFALWLLTKLVTYGQELSRKIRPKIPAPIAAFLTVTGQWIVPLTWGALGAYEYHRWKQGADVIGPAIGFSVMFLQQFFSTWRARSNPTPETK